MAAVILRSRFMLIHTRRARVLLLLGLLGFVWPFCTSMHARAEEDSAAATERRFKAAFIYKFAAFVTWPENPVPSATAPLVVGIAGADDIADELQVATEGRAVNGRPFVIRSVKLAKSLNGIHVLFVGESEAPRLAQWMHALDARPVLVITEFPGALEQGSVINFTTEEQRVRFDISLVFAERYRLRIDSRLLDVARHVYRAR
jgi:YfiR/HmsC-like